jgi:hypothetical protein
MTEHDMALYIAAFTPPALEILQLVQENTLPGIFTKFSHLKSWVSFPLLTVLASFDFVIHCKKEISNFPVPSRDVPNETLPGRESGGVWFVTSRLGTGKSLSFLQCNLR